MEVIHQEKEKQIFCAFDSMSWKKYHYVFLIFKLAPQAVRTLMGIFLAFLHTEYLIH